MFGILGERPYPCVPCGFAFKTKSNLYKHCKSRMHAHKLELVNKRPNVESFSDDGIMDVSEVEVYTELENADTNHDSDTESGNEKEDESVFVTPTSTAKVQAHVLQEVVKFLEKTKEERPKVQSQTDRQRAKLERLKSFQEKGVKYESGQPSKDGKMLIRALSFPGQNHLESGFPRIVPKKSNTTMPVAASTELSYNTSSPTLVLLTPERKLQPSSSTVPLQINPAQSQDIDTRQSFTKELNYSSLVGGHIHPSSSQIEIVNLPNPDSDPETATKALRDLEELSEKFTRATKEGVRLSTSVQTLPDKRVQVMIQVHQQSGHVSRDKLVENIVDEEKPSSSLSSSSSTRITTAALKERIQQLISANAAIIDTPKVEPPRQKCLKRSLSRQDSESVQMLSTQEFQTTVDTIDNVIVERIERDSENVTLSQICDEQYQVDTKAINKSEKESDVSAIPAKKQNVEYTEEEYTAVKLSTTVAVQGDDKNNVDTSTLKNMLQQMKTDEPEMFAGNQQKVQILQPNQSDMIYLPAFGANSTKDTNVTISSHIKSTPVSDHLLSKPNCQSILQSNISSPPEVVNIQQLVSIPTVVVGASLGTTSVTQSTPVTSFGVSLSMTTQSATHSAAPVATTCEEKSKPKVPGQAGKIVLKNLQLQSKQRLSAKTAALTTPLLSPVSTPVRPDATPVVLPPGSMPILLVDSLRQSHSERPTNLILQSLPVTQTMLTSPVLVTNLHENVLQVANRHTQGSGCHQLNQIETRTATTGNAVSVLSTSKILSNTQTDTKFISTMPTKLTAFMPSVVHANQIQVSSSVPNAMSILSSAVSNSQAAKRKPQTPTVPLLQPKEIKIEFKLQSPTCYSKTCATVTPSPNVRGRPVLKRQNSVSDTSPTRVAPFLKSPMTPVARTPIPTPPVFRFQNVKPLYACTPLTQSYKLGTGNATDTAVEIKQISGSTFIQNSLSQDKLQMYTPSALPSSTITGTSNNERSKHLRNSQSEDVIMMSRKKGAVPSKSVDGYGPYLCGFCNTSFRKEETLDLHRLYYCKNKMSMDSSMSNLLQTVSGLNFVNKGVAKMFSQSDNRITTNERDEESVNVAKDGLDSSLVVEQGQTTKRGGLQLQSELQEEIQKKVILSVPVQLVPIPIKRLKKSESDTSSWNVLRKKHLENLQKLKGQILKRKLKGKLLMRRSSTSDVTGHEKSLKAAIKNKSWSEMISVLPDSVSPPKRTKTMSDVQDHSRLRAILKRSESVPAMKLPVVPKHTNDLQEKQKENVVDSIVKSEVSWRIDVTVPVVVAENIYRSTLPAAPIYQLSSRKHQFPEIYNFSARSPVVSTAPAPDVLVCNDDGVSSASSVQHDQHVATIGLSTSGGNEIPSTVASQVSMTATNVIITSTTEKVEKLATEKSESKNVNCPVPLTSPKVQLPLTLLGHSYPSLNDMTHTTFCCLNRLQPVYVCGGRNKKVSMYSNWCTSQHNPNPYGLSSKMLLSMYNSCATSNPVWLQSGDTNSKGGVITHSSYWSYKHGAQGSQHTITFRIAKKPNAQNISGDTSLHSDGEDLATNQEQMQDSNAHFVQGGYKSMESYVYIRGRGRGKYVCNTCGIRCKKPSMLKKHIRTHTDLRPYRCRHCRFSFKTKGNLTKHMKSKAHQKKCIEMGIIPIPTMVDDSQIDMDALIAQSSISKVVKINLDDSMNESFEADDEGDDEDEDEEENGGDEESLDDKDDMDDSKSDISMEKLPPESESPTAEITPTTSQQKHNLFLQTLGIIAKQLVGGEAPMIMDSDGVAASQRMPGALAEEAGNRGKKDGRLSALTMSSNRSSFDEVSSNQAEDYKAKAKDSEIVWSLLNLAQRTMGENSKASDHHREDSKMTCDGGLSTGNNVMDTGSLVLPTTTPATTSSHASTVTPTKLGTDTSVTASQNKVLVNIPLGGFVPPLLGGRIAKALSESLADLQRSGPIVGQLILQQEKTDRDTSDTEGGQPEQTFVPFQFQHPFPGSESIVKSPVKMKMSPEKTDPNYISLVVESSQTGADNQSENEAHVLHIPVSEVGMHQIETEIVNIDPETFQSNADDIQTGNFTTVGETDVPKENILEFEQISDDSFVIASNENVEMGPSFVGTNSEDETYDKMDDDTSHTDTEKPELQEPKLKWYKTVGKSCSSSSAEEGLVISTSGDCESSFVITDAEGEMDQNQMAYPEHYDTGSHVCSICDSKFPEYHQLIIHGNIHLLEKKNTKQRRCEKCNLKFRSFENYEKHLISDLHLGEQQAELLVPTTENPRPFRCDPCDVAFRVRGHLTKHFRSRGHFSMMEDLQKIPQGSYKMLEHKVQDIDAANIESFIRKIHILIGIEQSGPEPVDGGKYCSDESVGMEKVTVEINQDHNIDISLITTDGGADTYDNTVTNMDTGQCKLETYVTVTDSQKQHSSASVGEIEMQAGRFFTLSEAPTSTSLSEGSLDTANISVVAVPVSEVVYVASTHGTTVDTAMATKDPHICGLCRQQFPTILDLKSHLITHAELRPYVCEYCDAGFTNRQSLRIHLQTHKQAQPYICGLCGQTFATSDQMWEHTQYRHSGREPHPSAPPPQSRTLPVVSTPSSKLRTVTSSDNGKQVTSSCNVTVTKSDQVCEPTQSLCRNEETSLCIVKSENMVLPSDTTTEKANSSATNVAELKPTNTDLMVPLSQSDIEHGQDVRLNTTKIQETVVKLEPEIETETPQSIDGINTCTMTAQQTSSHIDSLRITEAESVTVECQQSSESTYLDTNMTTEGTNERNHMEKPVDTDEVANEYIQMDESDSETAIVCVNITTPETTAEAAKEYIKMDESDSETAIVCVNMETPETIAEVSKEFLKMDESDSETAGVCVNVDEPVDTDKTGKEYRDMDSLTTEAGDAKSTELNRTV